MSIEKVLDVKSYAGNPHVGFDEGEIVSAATPRRGFLHCKLRKIITRTVALALCLITVMEAMAADIRWDAPSSVKVGQTFYVRAYYNSIKASVWVDASASSGSVWEWDAADQYKAATAGSVTFYFQYDVGSQRYTSKKVVTIQGDSQPEQPTLGSVSISLSSSSVAPGDAVSCSLNAYSTTGASITGGTKSWKVSSTTNDTISSSGVVTVAAAQISRKISVTGSYTYGGVTKSATATITVTRLPIALASIRLIAPSYRVTPGTQIPVSLEADSVYDGPITDGVASWRVIPTEFGDSVSTDGIVSISSTNVNRVVKIACDYSFDGITKSDTIEVQVRSRYDARANVIADYVDENNEEYQALNYIEATGNQWIVTDIRPTCTDMVKMKVRISSISKTQALYCSRTTRTSNTFTAFLINSVVRCDRNTNTSTTGNTVPSVMEDTSLVADYYTRSFSVNGVEQNALMADGNYTPGSALMLFASNTKGDALSMDIVPGDVDNKATYRLYYFELYSHGSQSPKHRLVPARRISDSVVGLYDTIWGEFYGPADNSDEFVPSPYTTDVKALQRYPWSGKVDITYTVFGNFMENAQQNASVASLKVTATDRDANMTYIATQLSGDLSLAEGTHAIVWDMDAEGLSLKSTNVVFEVSCVMAPAIYCVIDLSMGANATSYPVTYLSTPPGGGFNVDEYKTTKLVLRRIEAGTFIMGDDQSDESHRVTLTKPFFCGLFEVTQKQYSLITGGNPSNFSGDKRPVEQVSYSTIRGTSDGANWPSSSAVDSSSFLGKLRARTGLDFDLPTEAQWEYACRAGTTTTYSFDDSEDGNYYMWAYFNSDSQSHDVGTKNPNPWGFFDMHGNVWELCLDWFGELSAGTDPKGSSSGSARVKRGGSWTSKVANSTSSARYQHGPSVEEDTVGFRLVRTLPSDSESSAIVLCDGKSAVTEVSISTSGDYPTEVTIGDKTHVYCYDVDGGVGIVQTGIGAVDSSLDIPSAIDNKPLVAIGHYAFVDCGDIEMVVIPASVAEIGDFAFAGCSNLSQVTISGDIGTLTIGGNAFDAVTEVVIGDKQGYEFSGWTNEVGYVVSNPFHSASAVTVSPVWQRTETTVIDGRTWTVVVSDKGVATIGNGNDVAVDPAPIGDLAIPGEICGCSVTGIGGNAFAGCEGLTSITIPSNVTSVGYGAFEDCTGLTNVVIESESLDCIMPGLMQAKFDTRFDVTSLDDASDVANVSGVIAAYMRVTESPWEFSDPLNGKVFAWNETNSTFAYRGQMYLDADKTYVFGTHFDNDACVQIDGATIVNADNSTSREIHTGKFKCSRSGWYGIEFRFSDDYAQKGAWGNLWTADFGIGYRDDGSVETVQSGWKRLLDPGDGSLFRCDGLRTIFAGCSNIVSVTMPLPLVSRMSSMFPGSYDKVASITLTGAATAIPEKAFAGCTNLANVTLPRETRTVTVGANAFDATTAVGIEPVDGYFFGGWTNTVGVVVADPFHSADTVTVSPWWRKIVNVGYDANGGYGEMATQTVIEGDSLSLSANAFARDGYSFMGWSLSVGGEVAYPDMAEFAKVSAKMDGVVLYAVWKPQPPVISLEGGAEFQNASRFVSLSCDTGDALILFTNDGGDPRASGHVYKDPIYIYGTCTLRAVACGAGHYSDEVSATLTRTEGLSEAANLYGYLMETDEDSPWTIVTDVSRDGVSSVRSGTVGHGGMTWLQTSVRKAGTISFWWRAACEDAEDEEGETYWYDYGSFAVDGVEKARIAGNDTGWRKIEVDVPTGGKHVLRWEYCKDGAASYSPDCIWLDQVQWVPADGSGYTLTTPDPVPYTWLSAWGLGLDSDFETAARQTSGKHDANGRPIAVWEDYVAGTVPTDANDLFRAIISMQDDGPHISWTPNLNTNGEVRVYRVWGKADLKDSAWTYPANPTHRFFKVTVELP
ncbi:MAG: SUMF1/EgtB/PvdO family nonheme iron enzyme [Kiritimatiellae bacterium]|nr:SUMF1/EgtB/PvdO family nonheme iron enzyme [Kiritimatiellia bacterium]